MKISTLYGIEVTVNKKTLRKDYITIFIMIFIAFFCLSSLFYFDIMRCDRQIHKVLSNDTDNTSSIRQAYNYRTYYTE